ncbi:uncharacterized protein LOC143487693 isoform X2 [Brachyhypopomus gauderio]|uniref:uncharacterized protein LOC143487693 isoform X2 n=1 Tax=Brachyhypopomus gauderio TaxID=698409 RepID=UPI0040423D94
MSANTCGKFQANIFNKSKCQNCFRPRESHVLNDEHLAQAKPIYGGWLLLAPDGTNFENPLHRSRKWQRRFFLLYEHGLLRYALDEMATTLPQGTINLNVCVDVVDGEAATGHKHSLRISTLEQEQQHQHYIRAESKEIISGWQEALIVFPRTNKQNQKKKRKVEPATPQEPGPAKVAVKSSSSLCSLGGSVNQTEGAEPLRAPLTTSRSVSCLSQASEDCRAVIGGRKPRVESGYFSLEKTKPEEQEQQQQQQPQDQQQQPQQQQQQQLPLSSSSSRLRYSSSDSMLCTSTSHNTHTTHTSHNTHITSTNASQDTSRQDVSHEHSSTDTHTHSPVDCSSPEMRLPPHTHSDSSSDSHTHTLLSTHTLRSPLSSSQSSLDSEPGPEGRGTVSSVGGACVRVGRGGRSYASLADVPRARRLSHREAFRSERKRQDLRARTRSPGREEVERLFGHERRRSQVIERFETQPSEDVLEHMDTTSSSTEPPSSSSASSHQRVGRSERRFPSQKQDLSLDTGLVRSEPNVLPLASYRRAKSLDRRVTESSMTPDLLNFKKGWMTKLYEDGLWKKHWFVLSDQSLRYYRDSIAEEAADIDGEIDLSTCYDVTEFPVQRNYGFQIHSKDGSFTLSAMTSGIRRNWIQAIMKSVRPTITPDVTRKNVSLKLSVLKPSSLPDEQAKVRATLDLTKPGPDISQNAHTPKVEVQRSCEVTGDVAPPHELRKTRARDRRREGRSKTFDWAEFRPGQDKEEPERPARERVETLDISSSSSLSSVSSPASSPQTSSSVSGPMPGPSHSDRKFSQQEEEVGQARRRRFHPSSSLPSTTAVTLATVTDGQCKRPLEDPQGQSPQMEVDAGKVDVQVEIEHRWHQVETTPLREEKQVPITGSTAHRSVGDKVPPQELATRLDKELGQTQRELMRLQEQNSVLQEQLQDARGREHSARSATGPGQSSSDPPHQTPWQHLSKLNKDLKSELDVQRRKQDLANQQVTTLRRSYSEAQDVIGHHESEIEALQAKLASAMAEMVAGEQVLARMRGELKMEQTRCREREEERVRNDCTLRAQLRDSEQRLREVEASLLEKNQALRQLERQQELQRDQCSEVQRLQDKLTDVTGRLLATEEAQALREERERKEQRCQEEKRERERLSLARRLAESEEKRLEVEDRLHEARERVEAMLKRGGVGVEVREEVEQLQQELSERNDLVEALKESVRRLEEEKNVLACRCQELVNQIAEADREVGKLKAQLQTEESDYYSLESSYERVSEEFGKISRMLREKEEEVRHTKETYEQLVQQKEQDLNEAFVKMAALGSSLEEAELRLQVKTELLSRMGRGGAEPCEAERELKEKLVVAEGRISELEQHLDALRLGYADLRMERCRSQENIRDVAEGEAKLHVSCPSTLTLARSSSETEVSLAKRQRIRFSNIQCQKYNQSQGAGGVHTDSMLQDLLKESQDLSPETSPMLAGDNVQDLTKDINIVSAGSFQSNSITEKFISIIRALEGELEVTEGKLRSMQNRQKKPDTHVNSQSEQTGEAYSQSEQTGPAGEVLSCWDAQNSSTTHLECERALAFVESCRLKVRDILSNQVEDGSAETQACALAEIEQDLVNATLHMHQVDRPHDVSPVSSQSQTNESVIKQFARMLAFEGIVLQKMAFSLQDPKSDVMQSLSEIQRDADNIKKSHQGYLSVVYTDILAKKLMLERMMVDDLEKHQSQQDHVQSPGSSDLSEDAIHSACVSVQLAYFLHTYQGEFEELQKDLFKVNETMQQREAVVKEAVCALNTERVSQSVGGQIPAGPESSLTDITPVELTPYAQQIEREEAEILAKEIVERHLAALESCDGKSVLSLQTEREGLVAELKRQAEVLRGLSQLVETTWWEGSSTVHSAFAERIQDLVGQTGALTCSSLCMHEALVQAQIAYVACRLRADHQRELSLCRETDHSMATLVQEHAQNITAIQQRYRSSLEEERLSFTKTLSSLEEENVTLREQAATRLRELEEQRERLARDLRLETEELRTRHEEELARVEQERAGGDVALAEHAGESQHGPGDLRQEIEGGDLKREDHIRKLEEEFREKIQKLEKDHQEEIQNLHERYSQTLRTLGERFEPTEEPAPQTHTEEAQDSSPMEEGEAAEPEVMSVLRGRVQELESKMSCMRDELENKPADGDVVGLREKYQRDFDSLKETCERGFVVMEHTHQKVLEDVQRQHQREITKLLQERDRLLEEETNATIAAIEAMKNAHREELEKTQRAHLSGVSADIEQLHMQYEEELQSVHRELEVLSEQYSQKCLENAHLAQALEAERQALQQCQRENQQLHTHNQDLNNRLSVEITRLRTSFSGEKTASLTQGKDLYELEVLLRIKESEIQYLKQEISSLKDELQSALRDKKYACDKYKDIYRELSIVRAKADCDITKLREKLLAATEALGEREPDGGAVTPGYDIMKSKSNPDFLKNERSGLSKQRGGRSKVLLSFTYCSVSL